MAGIVGFGAKLRRGGTAGTAVANITNIRGPGLKADTIDLSAHDSASAYRDKGAGLLDAGQVTLDINFDPNAATHKNAAGGLRDDFEGRAAVSWAIEYPTTPAAFDVFSAFVVGFEPDAPHDDKVTATVTLEITGAPTLA